MDRLEQLFQAYLTELRAARDEAMGWWEALIMNETRRTGDLHEAELRVRLRWPCGPASHPRVIAVFRKYYLACDRLNEQSAVEMPDESSTPEEESQWGVETEAQDDNVTIEPRFLLFDRVEEEDARLGQFVVGLAFVPVGLDEAGRLA